MQIVITMAGLGTRFRKAGYKVPKYEIPVHGRTLFAWSMESLKGFSSPDNDHYFIVRRADNAASFIEEEWKKVAGAGRIHVIELDEMTDGFRFGQDIDTDLWYNELEDGLRAIAHAQSFQNLQPYKIIVDNDQISLIGLPDDMTSEADRLLNYGIVMFNFYAVMWAIRPSAPRWSFEPVTDRDLGLPADVTYVAKCGL